MVIRQKRHVTKTRSGVGGFFLSLIAGHLNLLTSKETDGYMTTAEIATDLGTDSTIAHNALLRLFNQGKIAKADVYGSGGQSRPSFCLWASSAQIFLGDD